MTHTPNHTGKLIRTPKILSMNYQSNPQLDLAYDYVANTNKNIFLTGKAGTGKTTFLQNLKKDPLKRMAVVAPTGVAAINAGGMTIHSFFQLPFGLFLPEHSRDASRHRRFTREKIRLIQSLDLLVIDEISMVRADLLDAIDDVLRRYKNRSQPFGGIQLLMIGDLHQLPPVVKDDEWHILSQYYETPYFFSSKALRQTDPVAIELKHIYRQSDDTFIRLLNKVRDNQLNAEVLDELNSRYIPHFEPPDDQPYITLTSHNASAQTINADKLAHIPGALFQFKAEVSGDFPEHAYPAEAFLELKTGAQVMFLRNDPAREKRYYNGKIGRITRIRDGEISVLCPDDDEEITVTPAEWTNMKYSLDENTKEVKENVVGSFTQYPLRLAWAITIHKSQGLTFERAIIDAQAAFAHGQVYVALSRCKSFEGIVLRSPIQYSSVRTDSTVRHFSSEAEKNPPTEAHLQQSKREYQQTLLMELFDFSTLKRHFEHLNRTFLTHENTLHPDAYRQFKAMHELAEAQVISVGYKFRQQLHGYFGQEEMPEANQALLDRLQKACTWFLDKIGNGLIGGMQSVPILTDNKAVKKVAEDALENVQRELFIKNACLKAVQHAFDARSYVRAKADAEMDFKAVSPSSPLAKGYAGVPKSASHPELYALLKKWRDDTAELHDLIVYEVLSTKSMLEIIELLPANLSALKKVKGIGEGKAKRYGAEILEIVRTYCMEKGLSGAQLSLPEPPPKPPKIDTKQVSLDMFRSGKSIPEIAQERGFAPSTIEGHLAHWIALGELDILDVMESEKIIAIEKCLQADQTKYFSEIKQILGDDFSYGEIKMVAAAHKSVLDE